MRGGRGDEKRNTYGGKGSVGGWMSVRGGEYWGKRKRLKRERDGRIHDQQMITDASVIGNINIPIGVCNPVSFYYGPVSLPI